MPQPSIIDLSVSARMKARKENTWGKLQAKQHAKSLTPTETVKPVGGTGG
jgi:hypothetical protein